MKRLFLAISLPDEIIAELHKQKEFINLPLKWIPESNLHVTVHFFGNTAIEKLDKLNQLIQEIADSTSPFTLELSSLLSKPGKFQHMIWAGFKKSVPFELFASEIAKKTGIEKFRKPVPHINLVRSKHKIHSPALPVALTPINLNVDHIELWESKLSPEGSTYSCLKSFTLGERKTSS